MSVLIPDNFNVHGIAETSWKTGRISNQIMYSFLQEELGSEFDYYCLFSGSMKELFPDKYEELVKYLVQMEDFGVYALVGII